MTGVYMHPTALVETDAVGEGTRIWAFCHVLRGARIGRDCNIGDHCFIEGKAVLGDRVTVKNGVAVWNAVTIDDDAFIGPNVVLTNERIPRSAKVHRYRSGDLPLVFDATHIGKGVTVGANATIVCGVSLGEHAFVGAGSVVTRDVPPHGVVYGVPARLRGHICSCGERIVAGKKCRCGRSYRAHGEGLCLDEAGGTREGRKEARPKNGARKRGSSTDGYSSRRENRSRA